MNIKTFTIIAIASFAVLSVTACGGKQKASIETEQTEETSKTEVIVSDNKLFINSDLYNMSEEKVAQLQISVTYFCSIGLYFLV